MTDRKQISIGGEAVDILDSLIADIKASTGIRFSYTQAILLLASKIKLNEGISLKE